MRACPFDPVLAEAAAKQLSKKSPGTAPATHTGPVFATGRGHVSKLNTPMLRFVQVISIAVSGVAASATAGTAADPASAASTHGGIVGHLAVHSCFQRFG